MTKLTHIHGAEAKHASQRAGLSIITTVCGFNRHGDDLYELKQFSPRSNAWNSDLGRMVEKLDWHRLEVLHSDQKTFVEPS